jgi:hypothetical protein
LQTDAEGRATFADIAPGVHSFAVGAYQQNMQLVSLSLKSGEKRAVAVELADRKDSRDPLVLMQQWREARRPHSDKDEEWPAEIRALPQATQKALAKALSEPLAGLRDPRSFQRTDESEARFLLNLASVVGDDAHAKLLREALVSFAVDPQKSPVIHDTLQTAMASTVADIQGDDAVPFFEQVASDAEQSVASRTAAVLALGRLHTEKSAAAFARLRDAAYGKPGVPERRESYTHGQRAWEAAVMALLVIPGCDEAFVSRLDANQVSRVSIDEKYRTAHLGLYAAGIELARVGAEWLVVSAMPYPMP